MAVPAAFLLRQLSPERVGVGAFSFLVLAAFVNLPSLLTMGLLRSIPGTFRGREPSFASPPLHQYRGRGAMDTLWEKYRAFAGTSLDMAQDSSTLKDIAYVLDVAQFWVQLTEGVIREASAETHRVAR